MSTGVSEHTKVNIVKFYLYSPLGKVVLEVRLLMHWLSKILLLTCLPRRERE